MSDLFGPNLGDGPVEVIEEVGDKVDVWARQFVNRWVFLPHQRADALRELHELLAEARLVAPEGR